MTTIEAVTELRREFARRGWDKKATNRIVFELLIHVAIAVARHRHLHDLPQPGFAGLGNPNLELRVHGRWD